MHSMHDCVFSPIFHSACLSEVAPASCFMVENDVAYALSQTQSRKEVGERAMTPLQRRAFEEAKKAAEAAKKAEAAPKGA